MTAKTSQKLADALRAAGLEELARRAEADEFHDYLSPHATPELELARLIADQADVDAMAGRTVRVFAARNIRDRVINGDFDASKEEGDEWAVSPEGKAAIAELGKGIERERRTGTHGPISPEYREKMQELARFLDKHFNGDRKGHDRTTGFALLVFPFDARGPGDRINYISNAERADMIVAMKEWIARAEGRHPEEQPGGAVGTRQ